MKIKKLNQKGFVLAETFVVTLFLMSIFTALYGYFYPLIGEYEKRETYDDVDSTYSIYWIKRLIEDPAYKITSVQRLNFYNYGYFRFECGNISDEEEKQQMCNTLVHSLQVENCDVNGNGCNIFISKYRIGGISNSFKNIVENSPTAMFNNCSDPEAICSMNFMTRCMEQNDNDVDYCTKSASQRVFSQSFNEYIKSLPDYAAPSLNNSKYRVTASFKHTKDNNNYLSFASIEVNK